jgi:hypothetical protein
VVQLPAGVSAASCRVADVNRDHKADLVCLNFLDAYDASIATLLGNGDGTFQPAVYSALVQASQGDGELDPWISEPADLNGDGFPDLLVSDREDDRTFVLLGDGTGKFTNASIVLNTGAQGLQVMDLNGDGKPDLVSPYGPTIWLGLGDGNFQYSQTYAEFDSCIYKDVDGDGHADAVCGTTVSTTGGIEPGDTNGETRLAILHGNADGSFNPTPIYTKDFGDQTPGWGDFMNPVAAADVNGDGTPDLLTFTTDGFSVMLGLPGGKTDFGNPTHYAVGSFGDVGQTSTAFADLNGDGIMDIASSGPNGIYLTYGKPDGTFEAPASLPVVSGQVSDAALADFNGDGIPDIAATGDTGLEISIGNGDGTFQPFSAVPGPGISFAEGSAGQILHGDFSGKGIQDLVVGGSDTAGNRNVYLFAGDGYGGFAAPQPLVTPGASVLGFLPSEVFDVDGDGRDDIVTVDSQNIYAALSNGDGTFTNVTNAYPGGNQYGQTLPAFADSNGDGKADAVYGSGTSLFLLNGLGGGRLAATSDGMPALPAIQGQSPHLIESVAVGDFDGDGKQDVAALVSYTYDDLEPGYSVPTDVPVITAALVCYGNGDGTFGDPVVAATFNQPYSSLHSADFNQDGLDDLAVDTHGIYGFYSYPESDSIGVLLSLPSRRFGPLQYLLGGTDVSDLLLGDLNHDGLPDLLAVNSGFFSTGGSSSTGGNAVTPILSILAPPTPAPPALSVDPASAKITTAMPLALTVMVSGQPGSIGPDGSITVSGGGYTSPASTLRLGSVALTIPAGALAVGADAVSVTYTPSSPSAVLYSSARATVPVTVIPPVPPGISIMATPVTIAAGATVGNTSSVTVTPAGGFTGSVDLTAAITSAPAGAIDPTLSFGSTTPALITGAAPAAALLTITTTSGAAGASAQEAARWPVTGGAVWAAALALFGFRKRRKLFNALCLFALLGLIGGLVACGGQGNPRPPSSPGPPAPTGTTPGNYTVTVTGTSAAVTSSTTFQVVVQ